MTLSAKQRIFPLLISELIPKLYDLGYEVAFGEAWRPPEVAKLYAASKRGILNSLHWERLAIDLILFKNDKYLRDTNDYLQAGLLWEAMSSPDFQCVWGGRFKDLPDGNHFSIEHNGVK